MVAPIVWKGPFSFELPESNYLGIPVLAFIDFNENGIDDEYYNNVNLEIIGGDNYEFAEVGSASIRIKTEDIVNYRGFESGINFFSFTVRASATYYDQSFNAYYTESYHSFTLKITDVKPYAQPEGQLVFGHVSEDAQAGDVVLEYTSNTTPYEFSEYRFSDGTGPATVTLVDSAGGRFRLDYVDGKYVLKVNDASLIDYDQGNSFTLAIDISDGGSNTVRNYIPVSIDNVAPSGLTNAAGPGGGAVDEHAAVGSLVGITARATDPKGGTLTYSFSDPDGERNGLAIDPQTGVVTVADPAKLNFEPWINSGGVITFGVMATDSGGGQTIETFTLTIRDVNEAPSFIEYGNDFVESDEAGVFRPSHTVFENTRTVGQIIALDPDRLPQPDTVTYSLTGTDAALFSVDEEGNISFKEAPNFEAPRDADGDNVYRFNVVASDGTLSTAKAIKVVVADVNEAPVIAGGAETSLTVQEGISSSTVVYKVVATDDDPGTTLTYHLSGYEAFLNFDIDQSGNLRFLDSPDFDNPSDLNRDNVYDVDIVVSDGENETIQTVHITVADKPAVNRAPVISGAANILVKSAEGAAYAAIVNAFDPDGDTLSFSISGGSDAGLFRLETAGGTARVVFKSPADYETPRDVGRDNVYNLIVRASDGKGGFDDQAIAIAVTDVNEFAPRIISNGAGTSANVSVYENAKAVTTVKATDADKSAAITYSISGGADRALFAINSKTGALAFKAAPNFELPKDAGKNNVYDVTVTASDGAKTDTQAIAVKVVNVNEFAPVISSNGGGTKAALSIFENTKTVTTVKATDADAGAVLTYAISGGADKALFAINAKTGALTFKAAPNFDLPKDAGKNNVYDVIVSASDGTKSDTQALAVTVKDVGISSKLMARADHDGETFVFQKGSGKTGLVSHDVKGFTAGHDRIDLSRIDADAAPGDQALRFVTKFTPAKAGQADGQVRTIDHGRDVSVEIDWDGNGATDMVLHVLGVGHLTAADFIL